MSNSSANPAKRIQLLSLFQDSWNGVKVILQSLYSKESNICSDRDIQVIPCGNLDNVEALLLQKGMEFQFPVIAVAVGQVEPNINSYNTHVMRREGYPMSINEGHEWWTFVKAAPCLVTFQVQFVTDDMLILLKMIERWMSNERWNFNIDYDSWIAKIKVAPDKALAMPPRTPGAGGSEQYKLTTSLRVDTYAGYIWKVPAIRSIELKAVQPTGKLEEALNHGATLADALNTQEYSVATDGIVLFTRTISIPKPQIVWQVVPDVVDILDDDMEEIVRSPTIVTNRHYTVTNTGWFHISSVNTSITLSTVVPGSILITDGTGSSEPNITIVGNINKLNTSFTIATPGGTLWLGGIPTLSTWWILSTGASGLVSAASSGLDFSDPNNSQYLGSPL